MSDLTREARKLCEKATQGEFYISGDMFHLVCVKYKSGHIADCGKLHNMDTKDHVREMQANARLIKFLFNNFPALCSEIDEKDNRIAELEKRLEAAKEDIPHSCEFCKYCKLGLNNAICNTCKYDYKTLTNWQWRGVKED
jgi:hypothetical protein